ncbi:MAG: glycosyltransferase family 2 protein [Nitrosarchaeum sp.]|nr:glycosyltransferase family 2 protein [Nitrosarchaeum sp.]
MKIAIGIPAFNEEKNIASIIAKLNDITDIVIVCNDGSHDMTGIIAQKMGAIVINHEKNLGYGAAIRSIFLKAREINPDVLVTFDADGQHRIQDIQTVLKPIDENHADIVIGSRFLNATENIPSYRKAGIKIITKLANTSLDKDISDSQSGFRAYRNNVLKEIIPSEYGMGVSNEILIKSSKKGFKIAEVPIVVSYEGETSTHHPISHGMGVILSTMKFISIEHPLKFYGLPGLGLLGIGLFFIVWTLQLFSETREIVTNISLIAVGTTVLGTTLLMAAIMLYSIVNLIREHSTK